MGIANLNNSYNMCNSNPNNSNCQIRANKSNKITVSIFCQKIKIIKSNIIKQFVSLEQCKAKIEKFIKRNRYKIKINNNIIYFNFIYPIKIKLLFQDALNTVLYGNYPETTLCKYYFVQYQFFCK